MTSNFENMHPSLAPSLEALQADTAQLKLENDLLREMATRPDHFDNYSVTSTANANIEPAKAVKTPTHEAATTTLGTPTITLPTPTTHNQSQPNQNVSVSLGNKPRKLTAALLATAVGLGAVACGSSSSANHSKDPTKPAAKHSQLSERQARVNNDATVAEAVKDSHVTGRTLDADIRAAFAEAPKQVDNTKDAMDSILSKFEVGHVTPSEAALAAAYGVKGSDALLAMAYDGMHNDPNGKTLPEGVTRDHALKYVEDQMIAEGTTHSVWTPPAGTTYLNHGTQPGAEQAFDAGIVTLNGSEQVYTMHLANGSSVTFKLFDNNCMNILTPVTITVPEHLLPQVPTSPTPTPTPPKPHHHHHHQQHHHHHHKHPGTPPTPGTPPPTTPPKAVIKVATKPPGPRHADQSPGTPGPQSPVYQQPGPGPDATPPVATTTPSAAPTYPETATPAPGEPTAPVVIGNTNGVPTAPTPNQAGSTQPTANGGQAGQGGPVAANAAPVGVTTPATGSN